MVRAVPRERVTQRRLSFTPTTGPGCSSENARASPRAAKSVAQQSSTTQSPQIPLPRPSKHPSTPLGDRGANLDHRRSDKFPDGHRPRCLDFSESKMMKTTQGFHRAYYAQALMDEDSQVIIATRVSHNAADNIGQGNTYGSLILDVGVARRQHGHARSSWTVSAPSSFCLAGGNRPAYRGREGSRGAERTNPKERASKAAHGQEAVPKAPGPTTPVQRPSWSWLSDRRRFARGRTLRLANCPERPTKGPSLGSATTLESRPIPPEPAGGARLHPSGPRKSPPGYRAHPSQTPRPEDRAGEENRTLRLRSANHYRNQNWC